MRQLVLVSLVPVFLSFALVSDSRAEIVTREFTGEVTFLSDSSGVLAGAVELGSPIIGVLSFDLGTPDHNSDNTVGTYFDAITNAGGSLGSLPYTLFDTGNPLSNGATIYDESPFILDGFGAGVPILIQEHLIRFTIGFSLNADDLITNDNLFVVPPSSESMSSSLIRFVSEDPSFQIVVHGPITSLALIPEPTTLLLFGAGAVFVLRRRKYLGSGQRSDSCSGLLHCSGVALVLACSVATATDCNQNGVADADDLAAGTSLDCNANATPDECEIDVNTPGGPYFCTENSAATASTASGMTTRSRFIA